MGATHCSLNLNGNKIEVTWKSATEKHLLTYDVDVATFIQYHYMSMDVITTTLCCTEYMHNQVVMRCHPSYQGEGPWFDWVSVHFEACTSNGKSFPNTMGHQLGLLGTPHQHCSCQGTSRDTSQEWRQLKAKFMLKIFKVLSMA
jgi:hypothetical protein